MIIDSTNVETEQLSERSGGFSFENIFMNTKQRIIVATFASNVPEYKKY